MSREPRQNTGCARSNRRKKLLFRKMPVISDARKARFYLKDDHEHVEMNDSPTTYVTCPGMNGLIGICSVKEPCRCGFKKPKGQSLSSEEYYAHMHAKAPRNSDLNTRLPACSLEKNEFSLRVMWLPRQLIEEILRPY